METDFKGLSPGEYLHELGPSLGSPNDKARSPVYSCMFRSLGFRGLGFRV